MPVAVTAADSFDQQEHSVLLNSVSQSSFVNMSSTNLHSQTVSAKELKHVMCQASHVMCQLSHITCHIFVFFCFCSSLDKVIKLVSGGSVINGEVCVHEKIAIFLDIDHIKQYSGAISLVLTR